MKYKPGLSQVSNQGDNLYEVKYIVDSHFKDWHLEFLVYWKGYGDKDQM